MPITLAPEIEKKIEQLASYAGMNVTGYLSSVFGDVPNPSLVKTKTATKPEESFAEIVAPIHEDFKKSGMSVEEVEDLITEAVKSSRERKS
jgi:hypothetical protein